MFTSDLIKLALAEDLGDGDVTSDTVIPENLEADAYIIAKEPLVVAGLGVAGAVFSALDPNVRIKQLTRDGSAVKKGAKVMTIHGNCRALLKGERTALNFLQRLSGIATLTRRFVDQTKGTKTKILDTRKTIPVLRHLDKYAVRMGGGKNHRFGLFDAIMLKDNHIAALKGSIREAVILSKRANPELPVIVEVTDIDQIRTAQEAGADRLLFDNMRDADVKKGLKVVKKGVEVEISGGITLERVKRLSKMGVNFISVGALTHSPKAADLSMEIVYK